MRRLAASGSVAVALLLAACAGEPEAAGPTLPPVTATPSPTAPETPELPPETEGDDADAATAFARYYLETVVNDAYRTGDVTVMEALSDAECGGCNNALGQIAGFAERGELREGGSFTVVDAAAPADEPGDTVVELLVKEEASRLVGADGAVVDEQPAGSPVVAQLRVLRESSGWKVYGFRFPDDSEAQP